ncbi:MAG TPA: sulfite exporter TauE/SafE family protein, partial [Planctomycetaceae bacterium]|nr:sulfite exporter TauE/SafE family protein [Planctomycetaceae bacterium]
MVLAVLGALLIGITLGLLGSGGSILTVPVLVYLLGHADKVAIAESLAIVAGIALVAMIPYARAHQVDWRSVVYFGLPGMAGSYLGAWLAMFVSGPAQLILFALIMLVAAWMMLRKKAVETEAPLADLQAHRHPIWQIALEGLGVGVLTGLVGVGGGFLIVPALVLLGGLSIRLAVGTSLAVIFLKSVAGFWKYLSVLKGFDLSVDWSTILLFLVVGI